MQISDIIRNTQDNVTLGRDIIYEAVHKIIDLYNIEGLTDVELVCLSNVLNSLSSNHLNQAFMEEVRNNSKNDGTFM